MKIKIIAVILVFISSFFGGTIETFAPNEKETADANANAVVVSFFKIVILRFVINRKQ